MFVLFTLFWCKLLPLKSTLMYSDLIPYLCTSSGVLKWIPMDAKTHTLVLCIAI